MDPSSLLAAASLARRAARKGRTYQLLHGDAGGDGEESQFRQWYEPRARAMGLDPNPDNPLHEYDYRAAWKAGAEPDASGHWPSEFKRAGHPNLIVDGVDTRTGQPAMQAGPPTPWQKAWSEGRHAPDERDIEGTTAARGRGTTPYGDVIQRYTSAHPDEPLTYGEVSDASREVRKRLTASEQIGLFFRTGGKGTFDRTMDELKVSGAAREKRENEKQRILEGLNQQRAYAGLPPVGRAYEDPEVKDAWNPVAQYVAGLKATEIARKDRAERQRRRTAMGMTPDNGYDPQDIDDWDAGLITNVQRMFEGKMRRLSQQQVETIDLGDGRKAQRLPPGYQEVQPKRPKPLDPREGQRLQTLRQDLAVVMRQRNESGEKIAVLSSQLAGARERLKALQAKVPAAAGAGDFAKQERQKALDEVTKVSAEATRIQGEMSALANRDKRLLTREKALRVELDAGEAMESEYMSGMGGVREARPLDEEMDYFVTDEPLTPETAWRYVRKLVAMGLSRQEISTLLYQHGELSESDLDDLEALMDEDGVQ